MTYLKQSSVSPVVPLIIDFLEQAPAASPFVPVACQSAPMNPLARGTRRASYRSFRGFTKKSDQRVGGHPGVLLLPCGIHSVTALVQRVSAKRITWPAYIIFDDLAHATASLIFDEAQNSEGLLLLA
ncbi:unnamed protein product [Heligmosomoides polygyrus]|uniref:Oxidoreductase n=1 Tax=Heligmosomoides polygyrus TaxID=6339 RepID=A0A183FFT3_HELPZ|nr:unnamed protein product [Heligmosomoides polygyrus]